MPEPPFVSDSSWTKHTSYATGPLVISNTNRVRSNVADTGYYTPSGLLLRNLTPEQQRIGGHDVSRYYNRAGEPIDSNEMVKLFEDDRRVAFTRVDDAEVSTVHLVINHQWHDGPPLIFETMIYGGEHDQWCWRYSTEAEASVGHEAVVAWLRGERDRP